LANKISILTMTFVGIIICLSKSILALDGEARADLFAQVNKMCSETENKGDYIKIEGDLEAGAVLRFVGVEGSASITKEEWDGINQKYDEYRYDRARCSIEILELVIPLYEKENEEAEKEPLVIGSYHLCSGENYQACGADVWIHCSRITSGIEEAEMTAFCQKVHGSGATYTQVSAQFGVAPGGQCGYARRNFKCLVPQ